MKIPSDELLLETCRALTAIHDVGKLCEFDEEKLKTIATLWESFAVLLLSQKQTTYAGELLAQYEIVTNNGQRTNARKS